MSPRLARRIEGRGITLIRRVFEGAPKGCVNLGLGQPTDPVPEAARAAIGRALQAGMVPYSPTAGLPELRRALAEKVHPGLDPDAILVTTGSQEALWVALMGIVDPGEDVLVAEPGYPAYRMVTELIGARAVSIPVRFENGWKIDPADVRAAWTPATRALIAASPSNPTGMFVGTQAVVDELHALCVERDAWLVGDEIYSPIRYVEPHRPMHELGTNVISIGSISKALSATGLRIGWLASTPEHVRGVMPLHQQVTLCAPTLGQHATLACLDTWGAPLIAELSERYGPRRAAILEALAAIPDIRFHEPEGAFYVLVDVSAHSRDTFELAMRLRDEALVITAPGEAFGTAGAGYLRLSFASEPATIREGVSRIARALASWR